MAAPGKAPRLARRESGGALITSRENRWLKDFRLALRGGLPTESGCIGVEGPHLVAEALRSNLLVEALLVGESGAHHLDALAPLLSAPGRGSLRVLRTTDRLFAGIADTETPQGIAALVQVPPATFDDLLRPASGAEPFIAILVGVQDPGNVGTILRTAEAFGATGAAACASGRSGTANPFAPKALRASAGAALRLPILHGASLPVLLAQLRVSGVKLFAGTAREAACPERLSLPPWKVEWRQPVALLIGGEGAGLPEEAERSADACIRIPMAPGVESLNAAIAAALILYEAARQRGLQ
jgi:TrmH family RNA methyltransferase